MPDCSMLFHDLPIEDIRRDATLRDQRTGETYWVARVDYVDELVWLVSDTAASAPRPFRLVPSEE